MPGFAILLHACGDRIVRNIVISLPSATKRRALIEKEFNRLQLPFQFYDAIDGATLSDEQKSLVDYCALQREARYFPLPGSIANWLTQMAVLKEFACSGDSMLAVYEDDARLNAGITQVLNALSRDMHGFDIVKLSWYKRRRRFHKLADISPSFSVGIINGYDNGSDAYVIRKSAARHLVESFPKLKWQMDHFITRYWENGLTVGVACPPVAHKDTSLASQISVDNYSKNHEAGPTFRYPKYSAWRRTLAKLRADVRMRMAFSRIVARYKIAGSEK